MSRPVSTILLVLFTGISSFAQSGADRKVIKALQTDIGYLASDALEGRRTGTEGERKAAEYIIAQYTKLNIPAYGGSYKQPYTFVRGRELGNSSIIIAGEPQQLGTEIFPFAFSGNGDVSGDVLIDVQEKGAIWTIPLYSSADEAKDPHFEAEKIAWEKAREAAKLGASGVLIYDSYGSPQAPEFNKRSEYDQIDIPAAFASHTAWDKIRPNEGAGILELKMHVELLKPEHSSNNIAAYIDNKAPLTVIIGAHYDHLGHGEDGGSLYRGKTPEIHNGADDNASGTAALIQLGAWLKKSKLKNYNYLLLHFSGEELGLLGSKAFCRREGIDSIHIAYMINMDMVGRLVDSTKALTIGGVGTSTSWAAVVADFRQEGFRVHIDSAGIGPSDHTSFYNKGIPVLFVFTGTHPDYHKPDDDADKINYKGELSIIKAIEKNVARLDREPRPHFTPTKTTSMGKVAFKVTLGIVPDYSFEGEGVRADGVTEGKPAAKAGLQAGDIIIKLGNDEVKGMQTYMEALSHQAKGNKAKVVILRKGQRMELTVIF
jgi:hypothetical protein